MNCYENLHNCLRIFQHFDKMDNSYDVNAVF